MSRAKDVRTAWKSNHTLGHGEGGVSVKLEQLQGLQDSVWSVTHDHDDDNDNHDYGDVCFVRTSVFLPEVHETSFQLAKASCQFEIEAEEEHERQDEDEDRVQRLVGHFMAVHDFSANQFRHGNVC